MQSASDYAELQLLRFAAALKLEDKHHEALVK